MMSNAQVRELFRREGLGRVADELVDSLCPSLALSCTRVSGDKDLPIGASKVGGGCDLPRHVEWPIYKGVRQRFLAQLNLEEVAGVWADAPLPKSGLLSFFYCEDYNYGLDVSGCAVVHTAKIQDLARRANPSAPSRIGAVLGQLLGKSKIDGDSPYRPCALSMSPVWTVPDPDSPDAADIHLDKHERNLLYFELERAMEEAGVRTRGHRLLGTPNSVQGSAQMEAEAYRLNPDKPDWTLADRATNDWRLLLQLDSDDAPNFLFGDAGAMYFLIRDGDLTAQRWDRAIVTMQCS